MTDTADISAADDTQPTAPDSALPAPQFSPTATLASSQPSGPSGNPSRSNTPSWRNPGTMPGAITAAVVGGLIAALLCAGLAQIFHL